MMRTIVLQRPLCYWHPTLFKPNMVTTAKMHTSLGTLPTTDCCLKGKVTETCITIHVYQRVDQLVNVLHSLLDFPVFVIYSVHPLK